MKKLLQFLQRSYRLTYSYEKQEEYLWEELKQLFLKKDWKAGFYEKDKFIDSVFEIAENQGASYRYYVDEGYFTCQVNILDYFPAEVTSDIFILASHFNNLLTTGSVTVNVKNNFVSYTSRREMLIPVLYPGEINQQHMKHYSVSQDIYKAFLRLVLEGEAPAIIIADLLNELNQNENPEE